MTHPLAEDLDYILSHTRDLWAELRGQRIFITGGTGFFGAWLLESYLWAHDHLELEGEITVLTRDPARFALRAPALAAHPALRLLAGDQGSFVFPSGTFHAVFHAAVEYGDPWTLLASNLRGTLRILDFAARSSARRVLFTSSGAVYGPQPPELARVSETSRLSPDTTLPASAYGEMKRCSEALGCAAAGDFDFTIARGFAFTGPYLPIDGASAFGNFIRDSLSGGPIVVKGDGTTIRSYLYGAYLAIWLWTILMRGQPRRAYNIGSPEAFSLGEVARRVAAQAHAEVRICEEPVIGRLADRYVPDTDRARTELGLQPGIGLDEAIRRTRAWHLRRKEAQP